MPWTSGNGPALAKAATALGIAGATDDAKATNLRNGVKEMTTLQFNDFYENLVEKILVTQVFEYLEFNDPIFKVFGKANTITAAKEVIDAQLLDEKDYEPSKRMSDNQDFATALRVVIHTQVKKVITNSLPLLGLRAVFANEASFTQWLAIQTKLLGESLQVKNYERFGEAILAGVKNIKSMKVSGYDTMGLALEKELKNMEIPSIDYNLGFADPHNSDNKDKTKLRVTKPSNLVFLANPDTMTKLEKIKGITINGINLNDFKAKIVLPKTRLADGEVILIEFEGFEIIPRVNDVFSQTWANNATIEYFLHIWYLYGTIPWAIGVKYIFDIDPANADDKDTYPQPLLVKSDDTQHIVDELTNLNTGITSIASDVNTIATKP